MSKSNSKNTKEQLFQSLVKYDTPYLVSTSPNNKKAFEDISSEDEKTVERLKSIFLRNESGDWEEEKLSVKDALNKILPPKKQVVNEQLWVQYVSCTPVTTAEVNTLEEGLNKRLKTLKAKETGICEDREKLYNECFDELIRQVTINCLERGILMMLVKKESEMTVKAYQNLYQSSIAYGIRSELIIEEEKNNFRKKIEKIDDENENLEKNIEKLEKEIDFLTKHDQEERERINEEHKQKVDFAEDRIKTLKNDIKNKWEILSKQQKH